MKEIKRKTIEIENHLVKSRELFQKEEAELRAWEEELKMIKENGRLEDVQQIQEKLATIPYQEIRKIFLEPKVSEVSEIKFGEPNYSGIVSYLSGERSFSRDRAESSLNRLQKSTIKRSHTLEQWFS